MVALQQNMGPTDRVVRGVLGTLLFWNGLRHLGLSPFRKIETLIGGAFLSYSLSGYDPLLSVLKVNTIPGSEVNVWNVVRHALPGQGIKPIYTQNVYPHQRLKPFNMDIPLAQALVVG